MHLETLLYMLLQSDTKLSPTITNPNFATLAALAARDAVPTAWFHIPATKLVVGMDDPENEEGDDRYWGWDIEKPKHDVHVHEFEAKGTPITNGHYATFLEQNRSLLVPASWKASLQETVAQSEAATNVHQGEAFEHSVSPTDGFLRGKFIRTMYGDLPLKDALHWPVSASYDELSKCAQWMGGRIPTAEEVRSIYHFAEVAKEKEAAGILTRKISAVNGYTHCSSRMQTILLIWYQTPLQ